MIKNKNILIKIGGSLLAPKNSQLKNFEVIKFLSEIIKKFPDKFFFIINGTGNIGHDFVKNNELNHKNILILQNNLKNFFSEIDKKFLENGIKSSDFKRFETNKIYLNKKNFFENEKNFGKINIFGGDILENKNKNQNKKYEIISSDKIFGDFIDYFNKRGEKFSGYFAGDTNGVYDKNGKTIEKINLSNFKKINFTQKEGDVTGGMENKFLELIGKKFDKIILFNGGDIKNWENIFLNKNKKFLNKTHCKIKNFTEILN